VEDEQLPSNKNINLKLIKFLNLDNLETGNQAKIKKNE
jgi:hypothetical protein